MLFTIYDSFHMKNKQKENEMVSSNSKCWGRMKTHFQSKYELHLFQDRENENCKMENRARHLDLREQVRSVFVAMGYWDLVEMLNKV